MTDLRKAAEEALDRMVAENERLGLYENTPAVKTYCGGKPNYCTTQEDCSPQDTNSDTL